MNYCQKCDKSTPTKIIENKEECMVCGSEIVTKNRIETKNFVNKNTIKDLKKLAEKDENTGAYKNAQTVGRNVLIGVLIIIAGILFSIGGFGLVINATLFVIILMVFVSIILFYLAVTTGDKK